MLQTMVGVNHRTCTGYE